MSTRVPSRIERGSAALSAGDPLAAIQLVSGDEGAHALAVRGIALAQLGEHADALELLERASKAFEREGQAGFRARALAARAEVLAATRELGEALRALDGACDGLEAAGDGRNAAWLRLGSSTWRAPATRYCGPHPGGASRPPNPLFLAKVGARWCCGSTRPCPRASSGTARASGRASGSRP